MVRLLVVTLLVVPLACSKKTARTIEGAQQTRTCGDVTAAFMSEERLDFHFANGAVLPFKPRGELYPPNRSYEIFSPDCAWVLLPQDNYGPYHLVKTAELEAYLRGAAKPIEISPPDAGTAAVLTDQAWRSPTELEFFASCCGGVEVYRVSVSSPAQPRRVFFAAEAPHGIRRADGGYAPVP